MPALTAKTGHHLITPTTPTGAIDPIWVTRSTVSLDVNLGGAKITVQVSNDPRVVSDPPSVVWHQPADGEITASGVFLFCWMANYLRLINDSGPNTVILGVPPLSTSADIGTPLIATV